MMRLMVIVLGLTASAFAQSQRYELRPNDGSKLELRVAKTGLYRGKVHVFTFPNYTGSLSYDAQKPETSQVSLTISSRDIKLMDTWLSEKDFKSVQAYALKDMLAADKYPDIAFVSTSVRRSDALHLDILEVRGTLTIRGIAKPVSLNVTLDGVRNLRGDAIIRLTDYGLKPPKAALGLIGTENEMRFSFSVSAD